jgi:metal-sulfur cluster biosynthetic enzyme
MAYHLRHCGEWVIRLGDGTDESARMRRAVEALHRYTGELFTDRRRGRTRGRRHAACPESLRPPGTRPSRMVFDEARLELPEVRFRQKGGRDGLHGEEMGHLLAELQYMQRAYPGHDLVMAQTAVHARRDNAARNDVAAPGRPPQAVPDPEVPCVTVADLGILRAVDIEMGVAVAKVTPTYSGCPAVVAIELAIETALRERGLRGAHRACHVAGLDHRLDHGRRAARSCAPMASPRRWGLVQLENGAVRRDGGQLPALRLDRHHKVSEFGSTPCKAHYPARRAPNPSTISSASEDFARWPNNSFMN